MNCVNCGCRLTFFNETDELWGGTDRAFCVSCRKKITPFLEESAQSDNLTHLRERRAALMARGITPEGYAHLTEYCKHLDALLAKRRREIPDSIPAEPIPRESDGTDTETGAPSEVGAIGGTGGTDIGVALFSQKKANEKIDKHLDALGTELGDSTRILCDRMERIRERLRLLMYLASIGAVGGVLAFLVALIVLLR